MSSAERSRLPYAFAGVLTGMVAYTMSGSILWAIIDWLFWPIVWVKWFICHNINMTILHRTFDFLLR